jgi:hypothetical protein
VLIIGHQPQIEELSRLPRVALLSGPVSVGKWRAAEYVREMHHFADTDVLRIKKLTMVAARELVDFCSIAPVGTRKLAIVSLYEHSEGTFDVLLKCLEELPPNCHVFLEASLTTALPETLLSRVKVVQFCALSNDQVKEILERVHGVQPGMSDRLAVLSRGTLASALQLHEDLNVHKPVVLLAVKGLREGDPEALDALADRWTADHTRLIRTWAVEALSGRWRVFNEEETGDVGELPKLVLDALTAYNVRDKLVIQSVLPGLVTE